MPENVLKRVNFPAYGSATVLKTNADAGSLLPADRFISELSSIFLYLPVSFFLMELTCLIASSLNGLGILSQLVGSISLE